MKEGINIQFTQNQKIWVKTVKNNLIPMLVKKISTKSEKTFLEFTTQNYLLFEFDKGAELFVESSLLKQGNNSLNGTDLIGYEVLNTENKMIGSVQEYQSARGNEMILVKCYEKNILVPLNGGFISLFDRKNRQIKIDRLSDLIFN